MKPNEARDAKKRVPAKIAATGIIPVKMVQFLIVDDHSFVRGIVNQHLKSCGFRRFAYADNGQDAIQMLKRISPHRRDVSLVEIVSSRPDIAGDLFLEKADFKSAHAYCVITDFGMPVANGLQLTKIIRCGETGIPRETPVVLLTGFSDDYVVSAALALDVNAFVLKPISRNMLWAKVERVLKSESAVKDAAIYAAVEIPDEDGAIIGVKPKICNPDIKDDDKSDAIRRIVLGAVQPGAELAEDIHGENGKLILRQGTVFSGGMLDKLRDLERMRGFSGTIPIKNVTAA